MYLKQQKSVFFLKFFTHHIKFLLLIPQRLSLLGLQFSLSAPWGGGGAGVPDRSPAGTQGGPCAPPQPGPAALKGVATLDQTLKGL